MREPWFDFCEDLCYMWSPLRKLLLLFYVCFGTVFFMYLHNCVQPLMAFTAWYLWTCYSSVPMVTGPVSQCYCKDHMKSMLKRSQFLINRRAYSMLMDIGIINKIRHWVSTKVLKKLNYKYNMEKTKIPDKSLKKFQKFEVKQIIAFKVIFTPRKQLHMIEGWEFSLKVKNEKAGLWPCL